MLIDAKVDAKVDTVKKNPQKKFPFLLCLSFIYYIL